ncbi:MAG: NUDIX domain-containing protein [Candidatus Nanopelagicales bacterium]
MPEALTRRAHALAYGDAEAWTPPPVGPAATVVLMRDTEEGPALYLMRRVTTMAFAAGMHVFPGGRVDPRDSDPDVPWAPGADYDVAREAARINADPALARALVVCAVRETFEECGVLLAVDDAGIPPRRDPVGSGDRWEDDRRAVLDHSESFADVLRRRRLRVDPARVPTWSHWVTPEVESRRYDVRFFAAALPAGQEAEEVGGEADRVHWTTPAHALAEYGAGRMAMLPPTVATVAEVAAYPTVGDALAAAGTRHTVPLMPHPFPDGAGGVRWALVDFRDGSVVHAGDGEPPAGSEALGVLG